MAGASDDQQPGSTKGIGSPARSDHARRYWREPARVADILPELGREPLEDAAFRLLADTMPSLCWIANGDGYIVWYNRRWHDYCGTTPQEMEGWGWTNVHDPDALPAVMAGWSSAIAEGKPFEMTFPLRGADGCFRPFLTRASPVRDATGAVVRWCGVNTEVTDQVAAEAALRTERNRARAILDGMDQCFLLLDADLVVGDVNLAALREEGRDRAEIVGKSYWEVWPGTDGSEQVELYRRVLRDGLPRSVAARQAQPDGRQVWHEINVNPVAGGLAIFYRDITERRLADEALRRTSEHASALAAEREAILGQLAEGVIVTDKVGRITFVNEAAERLHGVKLLGVGPDDYTDAYHLQTTDGRPYPARDLPLARAVLDAETVIDARWRIRRADGSEVLAIGSAQPIRDTHGRSIGAVLTLRDDTQRMRAELALLDLNDSLERRVGDALAERMKDQERLAEAEAALRQSQKMEAVGQLTGGIAHDFNNLLTVVIGNLDLGLRLIGDAHDPRLARAVGNAQKGAERAAALTQRLLAFSRRQPLDPKPLDVAMLLAGMSDLLNRALGETIRLELRPAADLWRIEADPNQLESALLNLAVNARDAMTVGGVLTITAENRSEEESGDQVIISVVDNGMGMPQEVAARAFEPFFTTKEVGRGTGLGLSMVYGFARQSGGRATIRSAPGAGTSISLHLPRFTGSETDLSPRPLALADPVGGHERILVAEDDHDVRAYTVQLLQELGYDVLEAADGTGALALLDDEVDLLFTDVVMPGMSGRELAEQAHARCPGLPILYTSGYTRDAIVHDGRLDPGVDMILKPFTFDSLARRIRAALDAERPVPTRS